MRRWAAGLAWTVAAMDLAQVLLLDWRPKHWGALAGAGLYVLLGVGALRGVPAALLILAAMPLVPLTTLALWAGGVALPVEPDAGMIGVLVVQLGTALASFLAIREAQRGTG
ncbi:MAG: hypothetical protein H6738_10180 [Alphaproteobacteria bacterium]|nr:hypothetical protein [Alphaproteobacteria bacterium]